MLVSFHPYLQATLGGVFIGLASCLLLLGLGRIHGVSGIVSSLFSKASKNNQAAEDLSSSKIIHSNFEFKNEHHFAWRIAYLSGLVLGGAMCAIFLMDSSLFGQSFSSVRERPWFLLIISGFLVGFGTVLGSGCTSGHGICGLARRSKRSLVATCVFMFFGVTSASLLAFFH